MRSISLVQKVEFDTKGTVFQNAVCLVDVDNDGHNELCVAYTNGDLFVFKGNTSSLKFLVTPVFVWLHLCFFLLHLCFLVTPVFVGFFVNVLWIIFFKRHKLMNSRIYFKQNYALRISTRRFYVIFLTPGEIAVCLKVALIGLFSRRYPLHESMEGQQKHGFYCCFMRWCRARGARKCFVFSRYRRNMSSLWCAWCEGLWSSRYLAEQFVIYQMFSICLEGNPN